MTVYEKICEMICDAKDVEPATLTPDTTLPELALDSLDYVELMVLAKREYQVTLTADAFIQHPTMTLRELSALIAAEQERQHGG
ncbi:acyl carrier protein [Pantoea sp. 1.19]|uniref:acyl carrier protein n=1 Tax=Pantoea sp. 1.19 TaxID=1925589 RepID=UPI000B31D2E7